VKESGFNIQSESFVLHSNRLTPWSRVLPEKLAVPQLVKFPAFYGT